MNLKEAFRYQNFLEGILDSASRSLCTTDHCLKVERKHLRNAVNPEVADETEVVEVDEFFSNDDVMSFMAFAIGEKKTLTEAIGETKNGLSFDLDAAIASNKYRQKVCGAIRTMLRYSVPNKRIERGSGFKFNVEGNQTTYYYDIEVTKEVAYDIDAAKKRLKELIAESDKVSADIDSAMVNAQVNYVPPFDVNDGFEDVMTDFLSKGTTTA